MFFLVIQVVKWLVILLIAYVVLAAILKWVKERFWSMVLHVAHVALVVFLFWNKYYKTAILVFVVPMIFKVISKAILKRVREWKIKRERKRAKAEINNWIQEGKNVFVDVNAIMIKAVDDFKTDYTDYFDYTNMPYGRATAFLSYFTKNLENDDFYFFKPLKTKDPYEMRENGILIAKSGIYVISEVLNKDNSCKIFKKSLAFSKCFSYESNTKSLKIINSTGDGFEKFDFRMLSSTYTGFEKIVSEVVANKIAQKMNYYGLAYTEIEPASDIFEKNEIEFLEKTLTTAILAGSEKANVELYRELKNYMNGRQGAGYAAEYGNITIDRLLGKNVVNEAQNLDPITGRQVKDGADRIVNGVEIQTKYCKEFSTFYADTFPEGRIRYRSIGGKPMKLEVPRDKYLEYCNKLQQKIDAGDIEGLPKGTRAKDILKKGYHTYNGSKNIVDSGTVESLLTDAANGIKCAFPYATVSFAIAFATAVWNGEEVEHAFESASSVAMKGILGSSIRYSIALQATRSQIDILGLGVKMENPMMTRIVEPLVEDIKNSELAGTELGKTLGLQNITEKEFVSGTITVVTVFGPDIYKFFSGKISIKQLFKNSAVGAATIGGAKAGGELGAKIGNAILPGVGMTIGGVVGSIVAAASAGMLAKSILNEFIEDDAIKMFIIFKEEFLDIVTLSGLNKEEFHQIAEMTFLNEDFSEVLQTMFSMEDSRLFAQNYVNECVVRIMKGRKTITNKMMSKGLLLYCTEQLADAVTS